jgi:hypothetical protein
MVGRTTLVAAIGLVAMLILAVPHRASACGCCACDFGPDRGGVDCGDGDVDCGGCIVLGGVPAPTCDECSGRSSCSNQTLCANDPQECSTDITGGCCVPPITNETPGGCFIMTSAACAGVPGKYKGDNTDCSSPCPLPAGAPVMSPASIVFCGIVLFALGAVGAARHRARRLP